MTNIEKSIKFMCRSESCVTCPLLHAEVKRLCNKERRKHYDKLSKLKQSYIRFSDEKYNGLGISYEQRMEALENIENERTKINNELEKITLMRKNLIKNIKNFSQISNYNSEKYTNAKYHTEPCFSCKLIDEYDKRLMKNYKRTNPVELIYCKHKYDSYVCHKQLPLEIKNLFLKELQAAIEKREEEIKH